jgi:hypothetical protein
VSPESRINTRRSKNCLHHGRTHDAPALPAAPDPPAVAAAYIAAMEDADDADRMDSMPLVDDPPSDISFSEFQECEEWTSDDDGASIDHSRII